MRLIRTLTIGLAFAWLCVPLIHAQDLSKYRQFSLGASLAEVSKQIDQRPNDASVIQERPATIQQMEWWPVVLNSLTQTEPVQKVVFSFYERTLYKVHATYDSDATAGLKATDMIKAISSSYGPPTRVSDDLATRANPTYGATEPTVAQWEDSRYTVSLIRDPFLNTFELVMVSKQLNEQAEASAIAAAKQELADAPQNEIARGKKAADDLETERQTNLKAFRP
jgi:hypothetical protein